jgi:hypothetical protein
VLACEFRWQLKFSFRALVATRITAQLKEISDLTNTTLQHRGCFGSVETSVEDGCLFGSLQYISALVSYEGESIAELNEAFRAAVDDYLATAQPHPF